MGGFFSRLFGKAEPTPGEAAEAAAIGLPAGVGHAEIILALADAEGGSLPTGKLAKRAGLELKDCLLAVNPLRNALLISAEKSEPASFETIKVTLTRSGALLATKLREHREGSKEALR